jgi:excisionase family DNA binding protein
VLILNLDDATRSHLAAALAAHAHKCRHNGRPLPPALTALLDGWTATGGQTRPSSPGPRAAGESDAMSALAVNYRDAGDLLGVSYRTVRRLVAKEVLPAVDVGGCRRIRTADLLDYVERLGQETGSAIARRARLGAVIEQAAEELVTRVG